MMVQALRRYLRRLVEGLDADGNRELELPEFEKFLTVYPDDGEIDASVAVSTFLVILMDGWFVIANTLVFHACSVCLSGRTRFSYITNLL